MGLVHLVSKSIQPIFYEEKIQAFSESNIHYIGRNFKRITVQYRGKTKTKLKLYSISVACEPKIISSNLFWTLKVSALKFI